MAIAVDRLLAPHGRIRLSMFPDRTEVQVRDDAQVWLEEGYEQAGLAQLAEPEADQLAAAWAYWRAFDALCLELAANPASKQQVDAGSASYDKDQRDTVCSMAAQARAEVDALLTPPLPAAPQELGTRSVPHTFSF